ncbi:unnamed protein product, partial [Mesorhabditis spiculigera]
MAGRCDCPFDSDFVRAIFKGNHTLFIGDSIMRGVYKDFVCMIENRDERLLTETQSKALQEPSFYDDRQIDIEKFQKDRVFVQAREYHKPNFLLQFHFTTRIFKHDLEAAIAQMERDHRFPRMVFVNSCLWDISRYEGIATRLNENAVDRDGVRTQRKVLEEYETRAGLLFQRLKLVLPASSAVFVVLVPHCVPTNDRWFSRRDGDTRNNKDVLRVLFTKAQSQLAQLARLHGFSVIDLDFQMRSPHLEALRVSDGIHWQPEGQRLMTQLIVAHLARDFGLKIPPATARRCDRMFKDCFDDPDLQCGQFFDTMLDTLNKVPNHVHRDHLAKEELADVKEINDNNICCVDSYKPYYVKEQAVFQKLTLKQMEAAKREAIREDIQTMRMGLLIQKNVRLDERDLAAFESMLSKGQQAALKPCRRAFPGARSFLSFKVDYKHLEWEDGEPAPDDPARPSALTASKVAPQSSKCGDGQSWFPAAVLSSSSTSHASTLSADLRSDREIELLANAARDRDVRGKHSRKRGASPIPGQPRNKERPCSDRKLAAASPKTVKSPKRPVSPQGSADLDCTVSEIPLPSAGLRTEQRKEDPGDVVLQIAQQHREASLPKAIEPFNLPTAPPSPRKPAMTQMSSVPSDPESPTPITITLSSSSEESVNSSMVALPRLQFFGKSAERLSRTGDDVNEANGQIQPPGTVASALTFKTTGGTSSPKIEEVDVAEELPSLAALSLSKQPDVLQRSTGKPTESQD